MRYLYNIETMDFRQLDEVEYVVDVPVEFADEPGEFLASWEPS